PAVSPAPAVGRYRNVMASCLPSLTRMPSAPGAQPAASSNALALSASNAGRLPVTVSVSQGLGEIVTMPWDGPPLPAVATFWMSARLVPVASASRTLASAPGCPSAWLNQVSPVGADSLTLTRLAASSRLESPPVTVAMFTSPESSRLAAVVWLVMIRTLTESGDPGSVTVWPPGPQV